MINLSQTGKLDGVRSWSLEAGATCPGSHNASVCNGCYAKSGHYRYPNVKKPRELNRMDWKRGDWVTDMVQALENERYFRWFDSGDIYTVKLAEKILEICKSTPWVKHWIPTQSWDIPKFKPILTALNSLDNVALRASAKHIDSPQNAWSHGSVVLSSADKAQALNVTLCNAYDNQGKCGSCRACYSKDVGTVGYVAHGRSMVKRVNLLLSEGKA